MSSHSGHPCWTCLLPAATNEVRLPYNGSLGHYMAAIGEACMQQSALLHTYFGITQHRVNGADATEIIVLSLEDKMYVNNLGHIVDI